MGPGFESQPVHKACHESDRLFCFKAASGASSRKQTRNKKANETRSGSLKSFEQGRHLGKSAKCNEADNPKTKNSEII
jgi:GTP cyclohydrolase II